MSKKERVMKLWKKRKRGPVNKYASQTAEPSVKVKQILDMTYSLFWQEVREPHINQHKTAVVGFST